MNFPMASQVVPTELLAAIFWNYVKADLPDLENFYFCEEDERNYNYFKEDHSEFGI